MKNFFLKDNEKHNRNIERAEYETSYDTYFFVPLSNNVLLHTTIC